MNSCTINIMDRIGGAWHNREEMGVLCVDFLKAFDSVEHAYIENVLQFFNFGPNMIRKVTSLLKNRMAKVITEDGFTAPFDIKRGTPQGDRSSPYIFIICIEVLLIRLKIETGGGLENCNFLQNWLNGREYEKEGTAEGFADDLTLLFKFSLGALGLILTILDEFKLTSGLELNYKKTQLMIVGSDNYPLGSKILEIAL